MPAAERERQPELVAEEPRPSQALAPVEASGPVTTFERMASDPGVSVDKFERLIAMQERINAHEARAAFNSAFADMQGEIPVITKRGEITVEGKVRSTFAKYEDIQRIVRPILQKHGFALRHRNEYAEGGKLKIIGILSHRLGHSEQDEFVGVADTSGSKNAIQALGSTRQYGMRYTTIALLNIASEDEDDDGQASERAGKPDVAVPDGFEAWSAALEAVATEGTAALTAAFNKSPEVHRKHLLKHHAAAWAALKTRAAKVKA